MTEQLKQRLVAQTEEARLQGLHKLATVVEIADPTLPQEDALQKLEASLWQVLISLAAESDCSNLRIDASRDTILHLSEKIINELSQSLGIND